jgi:citrate lyase subunit beta / citryl-CoA lyase
MINNDIKPRRTALYMPCSNARALDKAQSLEADVLLFDLEDAVSPDQKAAARVQIVKALAECNYGYREKIVRSNHVETAWGYDDLKALSNSVFDGILLPKVESAEQVNQALAIIGRELPVWVMIETPQGVLNVEQIAAHKNVAVLVLGTNDLAKEMRVQQSVSREEFLYAFGRCVMAARAFGCDVLDGVYNQLDNEQGFIDVCEQGKCLGFDGKTVIHPRQLAPANACFMPSEKDIVEAQQIMQAWQTAGNKGVLVVNGRLVEELHVQAAQRLLAVVERCQAIAK